MAGQVQYRAKVSCRVGGAFRRAGEVFPLPEFEVTPPYLERVAGDSDSSRPPDEPAWPKRRRPKRAAPGAAPGPLPGDLPGVERD